MDTGHADDGIVIRAVDHEGLAIFNGSERYIEIFLELFIVRFSHHQGLGEFPDVVIFSKGADRFAILFGGKVQVDILTSEPIELVGGDNGGSHACFSQR